MENTSKDMIQVLQNAGEALQQMHQGLQQMANQLQEFKRENEELKVMQDDFKTQIIEVQRRQTHTVHHRDGYETATMLGIRFRIPISAFRVGKILTITGLANKIYNKGANRTIPKSECLDNELAIPYSMDNPGETNFKWHRERTLKLIDEWMVEHGFWKEYISFDKKSQFHKFINKLYVEFVDGEDEEEY